MVMFKCLKRNNVWRNRVMLLNLQVLTFGVFINGVIVSV